MVEHRAHNARDTGSVPVGPTMEGNDYLNVVNAEHKEWKFENQTTACVIKLTLDKGGSLNDQEIWMDYLEFDHLYELLKDLKYGNR